MEKTQSLEKYLEMSVDELVEELETDPNLEVIAVAVARLLDETFEAKHKE